MSFTQKLWKEKKVDSRLVSSVKVEKYRPGITPSNISTEEDQIEWNSLGFAKVNPAKPNSLMYIKESQVAYSNEPTIPIPFDSHEWLSNIKDDIEDTTSTYDLTPFTEPVTIISSFASKSQARARIKQEALERLYGSNFKTNNNKSTFSADLFNEELFINPTLTSKMISPLDPISDQSKPVHIQAKESKEFIPNNFINTTKRLSFISKDERNIHEKVFEKSISNLHKELEEKNRRLRMQQEMDSYSSYMQLVQEEKQKQDAAFRGILTPEEEMVCDTDIADDELAKNEWELRELERIERDLSLVPQTDAEIALETEPEDTRTQYRFLQKYYHKGAFFTNDADPIFSRDYDLPTEADTIDKSSLPEILQVRDFGKRSRSKWKHLTAEDTTIFDGHGWYQKNDTFAASMASRMAGLDRKSK